MVVCTMYVQSNAYSYVDWVARIQLRSASCTFNSFIFIGLWYILKENVNLKYFVMNNSEVLVISVMHIEHL